MPTKCNLPILAVDPLELKTSPTSKDAPGLLDHLHIKFKFNEPEHAPVIAALPATYLVPAGITAQAPLLWHWKCKFDIQSKVKQDLELIRNWRRGLSVKWERSIAHWIPRNPTFVTPGNASQVAGGRPTLRRTEVLVQHLLVRPSPTRP
jgi:hypothetical protein